MRRARSGPQGVMASTPQKDDVSFFPTRCWGARAGGELIKRLDPQARTVWECAAGHHSMAHGLGDYFDVVHTSDAFDYGVGDPMFDFRAAGPGPFGAVDWIATNPPFHDDCIFDFVRLAYERATRGVALLMRLGVMCGQERYRLFYVEQPYSVLAPFMERLPIHRGRVEADGDTATDYAWFIWQKHRRISAKRQLIAPIPPGTRKRLMRPSDAAFVAREAA